MRAKLLGGAAVAAAAIGLLIPMFGEAADHIDAPASTADPAADITDVYSWMNQDASKLNLIMNLTHGAAANATLSTALSYVFHVTSMPMYGSMDTQTTQIICKPYAADKIECWAGTEYVTGNVGQNLESASKKLKVFVGRRNDPFFFELVGFQETVKKVVAAAPTLTADVNGCPALDAATSALLVKQLQSSESISSVNDNKPAIDTFKESNVLSIAVEIDKTLVNAKGAVLAVWASTNR